MSVQALHADSRATDSPARLDKVSANRCDTAPLSVRIVGPLEFIRVDEGLKAVDPAVTFESTHGVVQLGIDQPKQGGQRRPVAQVRFVLDHDGPAVLGPHYHREPGIERATDQRFNEKLIVSRRVAKRQRQNSSVRTKRERYPWSWWCVEVVGDEAVVPGVAADDGETRG
jgi:hypothetical protein